VVFEPFFRDESYWRFSRARLGPECLGLRQEPLVVMQEGAGVRQVIEDELRQAGVRLRDLEPRLELGLQESAKAAVVAGYGVTFISRAAISADLAAGTLATARVKGLDPARDISLVRSAAARRRAPRSSSSSRASGCDRPLGSRARRAARRAGHPAAVRRERSLGDPLRATGRWNEVPSDRIVGCRRGHRRNRRAAAVGGGSDRPAKPFRRDGTAPGVGADDLLTRTGYYGACATRSAHEGWRGGRGNLAGSSRPRLMVDLPREHSGGTR
jgi:hypothetical protein